MKTIALILAGILFYSACFAAPPKTDEQFLAAVRVAFLTKDVSKIDALAWSKGASDGDKKMQDQFFSMMLKNPNEIGIVALAPLPPDFKSISIASGKRYETTYPPSGMVKIAYKSGATTTLPYAVIDGGYYLVTGKSTDLGWKGPKDKSITVVVNGDGADNVKIHVKYNASGVDLEEDLKSNGMGFACQYISEVTVTSEDPATDVVLTIADGTTDIYKSNPLKGKGRIVYKKPD